MPKNQVFGRSGGAGIGATWYCFTVFGCYLLTPLFIWVIKKLRIETTREFLLMSLSAIIIGFVYRIIGRIAGLSWYDNIYSSIIGNLDLYFVGMMSAYGSNIWKYKKENYKKLAWSLLLLMLLGCSYCYYFGETTRPVLLSIYRYVMPSLLIVILSVLFLNTTRTKGTIGFEMNMKKIAGFTFEFYLWHSVILTNIARIQSENGFNSYLAVLMISFCLTCLIAFLMHTMNVGVKAYISKMR